MIIKLANLVKTFENKYGLIEDHYEKFVSERHDWWIERCKKSDIKS